MNRIPCCPVWIMCLAVAVNFCGVSAEDQAETGFSSLFDGKSLNGWTAQPAKTSKAWTVKDGMIVGDGDKGRGYLVYKNRELADFELKLSYRN